MRDDGHMVEKAGIGKLLLFIVDLISFRLKCVLNFFSFWLFAFQDHNYIYNHGNDTQHDEQDVDTWKSFCDFPEISHVAITGVNVCISRQDNMLMVRNKNQVNLGVNSLNFYN